MQNGSYKANTGFDTPVAIFNFNRPHLTRQVFEVVRQVKPARLLLVADGPRADRPDDARLCAEVRAIFDEIDWECDVLRNFSDINLGSFKRNSSGLDWVFDTVEEAIILEDDCMPSLSFFSYCKELLERYRNNTRIGVISGDCFVPPRGDQGHASYFFSVYALTWGWATWRRVWKQVDLSMSWWKPESGRNLLKSVHSDSTEWRYWYDIYKSIRMGLRRNAWDYQLILSCFRLSQICVVPTVNLVTNIGFGEGATHCVGNESPLANIPNKEMNFPLRHPVSIERNEEMDHAIFRIRMMGNQKPPTLGRLAISKVASLLPPAWKAKLKTRFSR
jgi:hypothetical protein